MSHDATILFGLILLTAAILAPSMPRRERQPSGRHPRSLGPYVSPYERWEAERKGQELLRGLLTPVEFEELSARGWLEVRSPSVADRVYRIPRYRGPVEQIEGEGKSIHLCVVPDRWLPDADILLMHKFLIEADEARYLQVANRLPPPSAPQAS